MISCTMSKKYKILESHVGDWRDNTKLCSDLKQSVLHGDEKPYGIILQLVTEEKSLYDDEIHLRAAIISY